MHLNYPIGDFLIRLKNASLAHRKEVSVPATRLVKAVAQVLKKEGFLAEVKENEGKVVVSLAYKSKEPVLMDIKLKSKPGLRIYMDVDEIEKSRGASIFIVSTSKGILSSKDIKKTRVGGEVIAEVW